MIRIGFCNACKIILSSTQIFKRSNSSKTHFERRKLNFPSSHIYKVISDVQSYEKFVPWCKKSTIINSSIHTEIKQNNDNHFNAELVIGFGPFQEKYISSVDLVYDPQSLSSVKATSTHTNLLEYLTTEWTISPSKDNISSWVTFRIDFKFKSAVYSHITDVFFTDIVKSMVQAFESRCQSIPINSSNKEIKGKS